MEEKEIGGLYCIDEVLKRKIGGKVTIDSELDNFFSMQAALSRCEFLVARSGSVMVSSGQGAGRGLNVFPSIHIARDRQSQWVAFIEDAIEAIKERYKEVLTGQVSLLLPAPVERLTLKRSWSW